MAPFVVYGNPELHAMLDRPWYDYRGLRQSWEVIEDLARCADDIAYTCARYTYVSRDARQARAIANCISRDSIRRALRDAAMVSLYAARAAWDYGQEDIREDHSSIVRRQFPATGNWAVPAQAKLPYGVR